MSWRRRVLYILIVLGIVAGLPDLRHRLVAEGADRSVQMVADQASFAALAASRGLAPAAVFGRLKAAGVDALAVSEDTLSLLSAQHRVAVFSGRDWAAAGPALAVTGTPPPVPVNPDGTYVWTRDAALAAQVAASLRRDVGAGAVQTYALAGAGPPARVVALPTVPPWRATYLPLGFLPSDFALAEGLGLDVVALPQPISAVADPAAAADLLSRLAALGAPVSTISFPAGVPGGAASIPAVASIMRRHQWTLGVVETPEQLGNLDPGGVQALSAFLRQDTLRMYDVPPWTLASFAASPSPDGQAVTSVISGVTERNLRLVYVTPVTGGAHPMAESVAFVRDLTRQIQARGFTMGSARPLALVRVGTVQRLMQALAAAAGGLLLLECLIPAVASFGYQPLVVVGGLAALLAVASSTLAASAVALGAACSFGGLASFYAARLWVRADNALRTASFANTWRRGAQTALVMSGITFCGALLIATVLGDTPHMLEWQYYRGVKLTYLAIPFAAGLSFLRVVGLGGRPSASSALQWLRRLRALPWKTRAVVLLRSVLVALLAGFALLVYVHRSGNVSSGSMFALELRMRELLNHLVIYRPREKEFLVGYPSVLLAAFFAVRRNRWMFLAFLLASSVAPVSLVDTFAHIRTPFAYSWWRECVGLGLGFCTATAALGVFHAGELLAQHRGWIPNPPARSAAGGVVIPPPQAASLAASTDTREHADANAPAPPDTAGNVPEGSAPARARAVVLAPSAGNGIAHMMAGPVVGARKATARRKP